MEDDYGLPCPCRSENFERVTVRRRGKPDYRTDFVACVHCKAVFHLPAQDIPTDPLLERDAAIAAKLYRKPGQSGRRNAVSFFSRSIGAVTSGTASSGRTL